MKFYQSVAIIALLAGGLTACAGGASDIVIELDPSRGGPCENLDVQRLPRIEVIDIRKDKEMEKTTIGGLSLGKIGLRPPEDELVRNIIANTLCNIFTDKPGPAEPPVVYCGIKTFDISTPATLLYWDVVAKIELILRVQGQDQAVSGSARERTWIWPGKDIIRRVANGALQQAAVELDTALRISF